MRGHGGSIGNPLASFRLIVGSSYVVHFSLTQMAWARARHVSCYCWQSFAGTFGDPSLSSGSHHLSFQIRCGSLVLVAPEHDSLPFRGTWFGSLCWWSSAHSLQHPPVSSFGVCSSMIDRMDNTRRATIQPRSK
jgi:hypothetical protein